MEEVIDDYLNSTNYDSDTDMYDIVDTIYENYSEKDEYYENIHSNIEDLVNRLIDENSNNIYQISHDDKGNIVNDINL